MALTYKGKHHRNPSGFNNKVRWLLSTCHHSKKELSNLIDEKNQDLQIVKNDRISWMSWVAACYVARLEMDKEKRR